MGVSDATRQSDHHCPVLGGGDHTSASPIRNSSYFLVRCDPQFAYLLASFAIRDFNHYMISMRSLSAHRDLIAQQCGSLPIIRLSDLTYMQS